MRNLLLTLLTILSTTLSSQTIEDITKDYYHIKDSLCVANIDSIHFIGIVELNFDSIYECDFPFNGVTTIYKFNNIWMTQIQLNTTVTDSIELRFTLYHELIHAEFLEEHTKEGLMVPGYIPNMNPDSLLIDYFLKKQSK